MNETDSPRQPVHGEGSTRRRFLAYFAGTAFAGTALPQALWAKAAAAELTTEDLAAAERLAGLQMTDEERQLMLEDLGELRESYQGLREQPLGNEVAPAWVFSPRGTAATTEDAKVTRPSDIQVNPAAFRPKDTYSLLNYPLLQLAEWIRGRQLGSLELTEACLHRLEEFGPTLECVISLTAERARREARAADQDLANGRYRGPLHGIPWGAKDLLAARGYPTTWGAEPFREQRIEQDAAVVEMLGESGAVLAAKLSLGALAWGDVWFGGRTRNPWLLEQGSSGSSAGSAAAVAGGLVPFAIGSETWGSIVSPCTRCGASGMRPSFGTVSRHGAMALSWTMDKLGPIARSIQDCGLVLSAIWGQDSRDSSTVSAPFSWHPERPARRRRLGVIESAFEEERQDSAWRDFDQATLRVLEGLGFQLVPIQLPDLPFQHASFVLQAEAAAVFDELTRSGRDDQLVRQVRNAWPNVFRGARSIPAVEYIQASRLRTLAIAELERTLEEAAVDVYMCPSFGANNLLLTNLTGHPAAVLPNGFREDGTPTSMTFNGRLFADGEVLAVAQEYQQATDFHSRRPGPPYNPGES